MAETGDFQATQFAFAAHIRDPVHQPAPADVEDRRMAIYRELFFNNISSFLAGTLPVLHQLLPEAQWQEMMRDFLVRHRCHSPYFLDIPREFLTYLEHSRGTQPGDPPFLYELAHYEWAELALSVADEQAPRRPVSPTPNCSMRHCRSRRWPGPSATASRSTGSAPITGPTHHHRHRPTCCCIAIRTMRYVSSNSMR